MSPVAAPNGRLALYELLPALYRLDDVDRGRQLEALLEIVERQARLLKEDMDALWDDFFIETCADWVVPYIGDLVANNPIHPVAGRRRADVARTISWRRRKGTLSMLEELARDVTGWGAHAVAFFELLGWTQNVNHLRRERALDPQNLHPPSFDRVGTVNARSLDVLNRRDGAFDVLAHTVDVRPIGRLEGWHNIRNVGFFLWRLESNPLRGVTPAQAEPAAAQRYHFSPLGNPAPLFTSPPDVPSPLPEANVPGPIRPLALHFRTGDFYGVGRSVAIFDGGTLVPVADVICKDLSGWAAPSAGKVAIDVRLGRFVFGSAPAGAVTVNYAYGFSASIGGGPYARRRLRARPVEPEDEGPDTVAEPDALDRLIRVPGDRATLADALLAWDPAADRRAVIQIEDNRTYDLGGVLVIGKPAPVPDAELVIQALDRRRPTLVGDITVAVNSRIERLTLNGLLIAGGLEIRNAMRRLRIEHCTLVPGGGLTGAGAPATPAKVSLTVAAAPSNREIEITDSIVGSMRIPAELHRLRIRDSILDAPERPPSRVALAADDAGLEPGPESTLERTTVFGAVRVRELRLASESIFTAPVNAERRQAGCVRFSFVRGDESRTPRRYRCQPDVALEDLTGAARQLVLDRVQPLFTSVRYGEPGYAQLALACPDEIRTGAEDGSEMGAFSSLKQPQRESNLSIRLEEYLPFGLDPGLIYVT